MSAPRMHRSFFVGDDVRCRVTGRTGRVRSNDRFPGGLEVEWCDSRGWEWNGHSHLHPENLILVRALPVNQGGLTPEQRGDAPGVAKREVTR